MMKKQEKVMNKILFLDIDGVLDSVRNLWNEKDAKKRKKKYRNEDILDWRNLFWVGLFCRLTKVKVVMSSSWRVLWNENMTPTERVEGTHKRLKKWGINLIDKTALEEATLLKEHPFTKELVGPLIYKCRTSYFRGTQILEYIDKHNIDFNDILIFDDDVSDIICYDELKPRVVKSCFYETGFGFKQFRKAMNIIRR